MYKKLILKMYFCVSYICFVIDSKSRLLWGRSTELPSSSHCTKFHTVNLVLVKDQWPFPFFSQLLHDKTMSVVVYSLTCQLFFNSCLPLFPCVLGSHKCSKLFWTPLYFTFDHACAWSYSTLHACMCILWKIFVRPLRIHTRIGHTNIF